MLAQTFERNVLLPVSSHEAFAWHERPGALQRLLPPWEHIRVARASQGIRDGSQVEFVHHLGPLAIPSGISSFMAPLPAGSICINSNPRAPARHVSLIMSNFNYQAERSDLVWDAHLLTTCCRECSIFGLVALSPT